jgi:UDP-GlcNAc:undecaprenyl-phosphate GlcNAc-1-phosphate transferase
MLIFLLSFLGAGILTILSTPMVRSFAHKIGAIDHPSDRKVHRTDTPRIGGLAIFLGFMIVNVLALMSLKTMGLNIHTRPIIGILIGGALVVLIGLIDDIRGLSPWNKLFWQTVAAGIAIFNGVEINFINNPLSGIIPLGMLSLPITLIWLVGMTNAVNLIDGLDGLASGVTAIAAVTIFVVALRTHQLGSALLLASLAGASLGFLKYNFFPASIFLGDSGSYFLGFTLAAAAVIGVFKSTLVLALIVPILILGVPIFDTIFAIFRRLKEKKGLFSADNRHIHHFLLRAGLTQREAVMAIYIVCFILSMAAIVMALQK